jgi:hydroxymethylpyrimidine pyrophosphatase-like HAD family hydrolase
MITYNGAVVFLGQHSSLIFRRVIDRKAFEAVILHCRSAGLRTLAYACGVGFGFSPRESVYVEGAVSIEHESNGMRVQTVNNILEIDDDFVAVLIESHNLGDGAPFARSLLDASRGSLRVTRSGNQYLEVCHPMGTKLCAMNELARMTKIGLDEIMAIGNSFNDLEMIEGAGVGIAVANAPVEVQAAATRTSTRPGAAGVVEALRVLTRSMRSMRSLGHTNVVI